MTDSPTWLHASMPDWPARHDHISGRIIDTAAALVVAADGDEGAVLAAAVEWAGLVTAREVADVAAGVIAVAVEELARATGAPAAAVIQRLREAAERRPMEVPTREEAR